MPRRLLGFKRPCLSWERLGAALEADLERPNVDEIVESQDQKLQEVKRSVFNGLSIPLRLTAEAPVLLSTISELPGPALMVSTHYNDSRGGEILEGGDSDSLFADSAHATGEADIDFSKPENLFLLEAPIDARKDQNMLMLACTIPKRTFMSRLLRTYPVNRKRLAFIQRRPSSVRTLELMGNLIVKGSDSKEVTISCQVCGQKFSRQYQFQRHILVHPDPENKKFLCQICGKRFNRADHLNRHAILHGDVKLHKCLLCGEEFDRASHLDRHRRKQHPPAGQQPSQTPPSTPGQIKSPTMGMPGSPGFEGFLASPQETLDQQSSGHNLHLLAAVANPENQGLGGELDLDVENGEGGGAGMMPGDQPSATDGVEPERPYPCEVCGRKFIRATHLRRHMRIHTGEKPFACHICGRRYARGDYLRAHIHAHRRDKIHKCKHCGEVFHDLTRFADHCRALHKDLDDQFGNPKPPPECSPPPPSFTTLLENTLGSEQEAEEITVVPSMNAMEMSSSVPITLVTLPEASSYHDISIAMEENPAQSVGYTPNHTPLTSPDLQLHSQPHLLGQQNGRVQIADSTANERHAYNHSPSLHKKATPISYVDSVTQYIYSDCNHHGNTTTIFPTPQPSPLVDHQGHVHPSR